MVPVVRLKEFSMQKIEKEKSDLIWRLKGIAIFTVFFAHVPYNGPYEWISYIYNLLGMLGVPSFLILSGFFDYNSSTNLIKTARNLFVPVLIWGLISYVFANYIALLSLHVQVLDVLKWIYGCGSWLYFVPVLFWCKILSMCFDRYYYILLLISLMSIYLTAKNMMPYNEYFTAYTNPFNFYVYFQTGRIIRQNNIELLSVKLFLMSLAVCIISLCAWSETPSYFSLYSVVVSICSFVVLYRIAYHIKYGEEVGKLSYVIYLVHLVPASILNRHGYIIFGAWFEYLKVPLIFFLILIVVWIGKLLLQQMHNVKLYKYLGYR